MSTTTHLVEPKLLGLAQRLDVLQPHETNPHGNFDSPHRRNDASLPYQGTQSEQHFYSDDFQALVEPVGVSLEAWARRIAAEAPPMTDHLAAAIVSILRGA